MAKGNTYIATEKLVFGHALLENTAPSNLSLKDINKVISEASSNDIEKFGLFEVTAPDFNKYYPDVTSDDLDPKEQDYVTPTFRALSSITLNKFGPIDFSKSGVLEASANLLTGQAVFTNHEQIVGNEVGVVLETEFQSAYTAQGVKVPSGLNARLKIDGKSNPKLARDIIGNPPVVHSVSVTVQFVWEQSHPKMDRDEFFRMLGQFDEKGNLIKRVVTEIIAYHEISLVSHGADPYAQIVGDDGKINNPKYAANVSKFSAEDFTKMGHHYDYKNSEDIEVILSMDNVTILDKFNNNENENNTMKELLAKFAKVLSLEGEDHTEEVVLEALSKAIKHDTTDLDTQIEGLENFVTSLIKPLGLKAEDKPSQETISNALTQLLADKATADDKAQLADDALQSTREEAVRLYKLAVKKPDQAMLDMIAKAEFDAAKAFLSQYKTQAEEKFTGKCGDCGSENVSRLSSVNKDGIVTPGDDDNKGDGDEPKELSLDEAASSIREDFFKSDTSLIHGK